MDDRNLLSLLPPSPPPSLQPYLFLQRLFWVLLLPSWASLPPPLPPLLSTPLLLLHTPLLLALRGRLRRRLERVPGIHPSMLLEHLARLNLPQPPLGDGQLLPDDADDGGELAVVGLGRRVDVLVADEGGAEEDERVGRARDVCWCRVRLCVRGVCVV